MLYRQSLTLGVSWTIVFGAFFIVAFLKATTSIIASIASQAVWVFLTWLFWLAGAAAMTNYLDGGLSCGSYDGPHCSMFTPLFVFSGAQRLNLLADNLNATLAFGWIQFILFTFLFVFLIFLGVRSVPLLPYRGHD